MGSLVGGAGEVDAVNPHSCQKNHSSDCNVTVAYISAKGFNLNNPHNNSNNSRVITSPAPSC